MHACNRGQTALRCSEAFFNFQSSRHLPRQQLRQFGIRSKPTSFSPKIKNGINSFPSNDLSLVPRPSFFSPLTVIAHGPKSGYQYSTLAMASDGNQFSNADQLQAATLPSASAFARSWVDPVTGMAMVLDPPTDTLAKDTDKLMRDYVQKEPFANSHLYKTFSFYQFRSIPTSELRKIQYFLLKDLRAMNMVGRIYISTEGINAQVSCPGDKVEEMKTYFGKEWAIFDRIRFNPAMSDGRAFKKLHVRIKRQLVSDGIETTAELMDPNNAPEYLTPQQWHEELSAAAEAGEPPILIDMRNYYETQVGYFENSICPDVTTFKENIQAMYDIVQDRPKDAPVYMSCTGGIRCTRVGPMLKAQGYTNVKMLQGGVTAYGRFIQDQRRARQEREALDETASSPAMETAASLNKPIKSLFKGINFTFDKRLGEPITDEVLANCHLCGTPCSTYCNCANTACNLLMIACPSCSTQHQGTCGESSCVDMVKELRAKQAILDKTNPGMKARPGIKSVHEYRRRVRPEEVLGLKKLNLTGTPSEPSLLVK